MCQVTVDPAPNANRAHLAPALYANARGSRFSKRERRAGTQCLRNAGCNNGDSNRSGKPSLVPHRLFERERRDSRSAPRRKSISSRAEIWKRARARIAFGGSGFFFFLLPSGMFWMFGSNRSFLIPVKSAISTRSCFTEAIRIYSSPD